MEINYSYIIAFCIIVATVFFVCLQIHYEKIILDNFSRCDFQTEKINNAQQKLNEYNINIVQLGWIPVTGRYAQNILFCNALNCEIYKDFVIFKLKKNNSEYISRIVPKNQIKTKYDILGGNMISFNVNNIQILCQVYSRINDFKIMSF